MVTDMETVAQSRGLWAWLSDTVYKWCCTSNTYTVDLRWKGSFGSLLCLQRDYEQIKFGLSRHSDLLPGTYQISTETDEVVLQWKESKQSGCCMLYAA